jgi:putative salt-induced outer membrane protein YdiY
MRLHPYIAVGLILAGTAASLARAQETPTPPAPPPAAAAPATPPGPKWSDTAELGFVATSGNAETSTLGLKNTLTREHGKSRIEVKLGGIRVTTTDKNIFAVGTATDFDAVDGDPKTTAESYYLNGRYDRKITERFFWFAGAGWDRNEPAGIQNRTTVGAGVGNIWIDVPRRNWRTDYAITETKEDDIVEPPDFNDTFAGVRVSSKFTQKFGAQDSGAYVNDTAVDENLDDTSDWRVNMTNSVALNMSTRIALKVSLQWLYDNVPAFMSVDLFGAQDAQGNPINPAGIKVPVEADSLDTIFTTALVIKY